MKGSTIALTAQGQRKLRMRIEGVVLVDDA
jgi:hypothetical protein